MSQDNLIEEQDGGGRSAGHVIRPQGKGSRGRLFESDVMERLTRVSPNVAVVVYGSIIVAMIALNAWLGAVTGALAAILLFVVGVLSWTLFEYVAHRYVFHLISESAAMQRFSYTIHGVHHEFPRDDGRLFMPPVAGLPVAAILFGLMYLVLGPRTFMFFAGFASGYVTYAYIHHCIHRFRPPRALKFLWRHHLQHHYKCPDMAYGVSSPMWDLVFRTMPAAEPAQSRLEEDPNRVLRA